MPDREFCPHCRMIHDPVDETRAEIEAIDQAIEWLCWIGMVSIVLVLLLCWLLA